jgi:hypothetical protein
VERGGAFRAQKQCGIKPLPLAPKSRARIMPYPTTTCGLPLITKVRPDLEEALANDKGLIFVTSMPNPRVARGHPLVVQPRFDPEEDSVNGKGLAAGTSTQSINRRRGSSG